MKTLMLGIANLTLAGLAALPLTPVQGADPPPAPLNPAGLNGKDSAQNVYVSDSSAALERLALAGRLERLKEWNKSADVYQEVLEKYGDRAVPSRTDPNGVIDQYVSAALVVQERLGRWPAEGLAAYRAKYEPAASALLEQAGPFDLASLHRVVFRYFPTEAGKSAGLRLVDLSLESGDFSAAAWMGQRLLAWHPSLLAERPGLLYRTAVACHLAGDDAAARARLAELRDQFPHAAGVIRGQQRVLLDELNGELARPAPQALAREADSWPTFGGAADRAAVPDAAGRTGARLFSIELNQANGQRNPPGPRQGRDLERLKAQYEQSGMTLGILPVVDRGELFFQDGSRIYAVGLDSGLPLPGWAATYGGQLRGQYVAGPASPLRTRQLTLSVSEESVLAVMNSSDAPADPLPQGRSPGRLVCLNRKTGQERWTLTPAQLPPEAATARQLTFSGCPLVVGDSVFVIARGAKGMGQFEDCCVICLDAAAGKFRWASYLASAGSPALAFADDVPTPVENVSHLAYASGRVYVVTNLGATAALDAYNGMVLWLDLYPQAPTPKPATAFPASSAGRAPGARRPSPGSSTPQ